jgi:hypothetical protein
MRPLSLSQIRRGAACALLLGVLTTAAPAQPALAADALIPHDGSTEDVPLVQQAGPAATMASAGQLVPTTQFVEDPTRQAGGEDDAQRANERQTEQRNDDGEPRRK